ncbi:Response regulator [Caenorhabditis elegans]|uniref:Response regulator n=1 Tax=Caenorhabditis elegans TaxID=6239 RepID=A0A3P6PAX1_CAEEL|nr:Response regulator [Caenorhabditis elegans]VDJ65105.1 Response regulator [Caenorhabditis elegans]|eukprot:NP_001355519.1 Uncharacterized protein CELE_D1086.21 [Caenorhabditis elegans]
MELKMEVYTMATYCIFSQIKPELLEMIVLTAEEQHYKHISYLVWNQPEEMIELIAKHRPDMIIMWKNIPIRDNYLMTLNLIVQKLKGNYDTFKLILGANLPIMASKDEFVNGKQKVNPNIILKFLSHEEKDKDVKWELMKTIQSWDNENAKGRKRPFDFPFTLGFDS